MESTIEKGHRPSLLAFTRKKKKRNPVGVAELARRFSCGSDLWTGATLIGQDAADWLAIQYELMEATSVAV